MRHSFRLLGLLVGAALVFACSQGDPDQASTWIKQLSAKDPNRQVRALEELARIADPTSAGAVEALLGSAQGEVKLQAVKTLRKLGQKSSVPALTAALDYGVAVGTDPATKLANETNKEIAETLGQLRDASAVDALIRLAREAKDAYVRVAAVNSLGAIGDRKAVDVLMEVATNEAEETYVNKKAVQALGDLGDPKAVPAIKKMLFHERRGVSFYPEASFAAYQIGPDAAEPLLEVLAGKDEPLNQWADKHNVKREALYIKAAEILGDLGERRAIPMLIKNLSYHPPGLDPELVDALALLVRRNSAMALAKMRAKEAIPVLGKAAAEEQEGNIRATYAEALVSIGDRSALPFLVRCALEGDPMDKSVHARKGCYVALSKLGDEKTLATWEKWEKEEPQLSIRSCMSKLDYSGEAGRKAAEEHCTELANEVVKIVKENKPRLTVYGECRDNVDCWIGKLKDSNKLVRERAAIELGRLGDPKAIAPLMEALRDQELEPRYAAIASTDWLASNSNEALEAAKKQLDKLDAQIAEEQGKVHFARINEDLKRLAVKIRRLDRIGS